MVHDEDRLDGDALDALSSAHGLTRPARESPRSRMMRPLLLFAVALGAGCVYDFDLAGKTACDPQRRCAPGFGCFGGRCEDLSVHSCEVGTSRCVGDVAWRCDASDHETGEDCQAASLLCVQGACVPDCAAADACSHSECAAEKKCRCGGATVETACDDGADNDCDDAFDCQDPDCAAVPSCLCKGVDREPNCADGVDGDCDGKVDCADPDCLGLPCRGGDACTVGETCKANGACTGTPRGCDDGNPCTSESCDPALGCPAPTCAAKDASCGAAGERCTADCRCCPSVPAASETSCTNGVDDDCDGKVDCADPDCASKACNDHDACTSGETCAAGLCQGGASKSCNTAPGPCFSVPGSCDPSSGACLYAVRTSGACDDRNPCTTGDACTAGGQCTGAPCGPCASCSSSGCVKRNDGYQWGGSPSKVCCGGTPVDISTNPSHCGGCGSKCDLGTCESVEATDACGANPPNVSGRCRCYNDGQCPRNQRCRDRTPAVNRCNPLSQSECANGESLVTNNDCPNFCRY